MTAPRCPGLAAGIVLILLLPSLSAAGTFLDFSQNNVQLVTHPSGYTGTGGEKTVNVCLDPGALPPGGANAEQAIRNALATYNRNTSRLGNSVANPGGSNSDFESVLLHELGHCIGMDHSTLGPSEAGFGSPALYFANSYQGGNAVFDAAAGSDGIRATRDDVRGDDINRNWFRKAANNPFEAPPATIDRNTHSVLLADLPVGHTFVELATSFGPCNGGQPNSSALRGQPATQNVMFPVICSNNALRELAHDDLVTLRIARSGVDGTQGGADDYTLRLVYVGQSSNCDTSGGIKIRFTNDAGFAVCNVSGQFLGTNDIGITSGVIRFQDTVNWHFNQDDTTGGGLDTSAPSAPSGLSATPASSSAINLSWTASTDNVGVTGYRVERCQGAGCSSFAPIGTTSGTTSYADSGLAASVSYSYRVRATDAANNLSGYSNTASATTQAGTDVTAPSAPSSLAATAGSSSAINLSWTASTDNVGVTGYRIERCQGAGCSSFAPIGTTSGTTSYADSGLAASVSYSYRVRATDAANNLSGYSNTASATTQGSGSTPLVNGVAVDNISGAAGSERFFTLEVPSGASSLVFALSGSNGDADLYVRFGSAPTTTTFDCRPFTSGSNETCPIATPQTGTYHVMVRAFSNISGISLVGSYQVSTCSAPCIFLNGFEN